MERSESTAADIVRRSRKVTRRRWLQFSLRGFLVVLTVLAVWFGFIVTNARNRREAVQAIIEAGGEISYDDPDLVDPIDQQFLASDDKDAFRDLFTSPKEVCFYPESHATDAICSRLLDLPDLRAVTFDNCPITDRGVEELAKLNELRTLNLSGTRITDDGLARLRGLRKLETLELVGTAITDNGIAVLTEMRELSLLDVSLTQVTRDGIHRIETALPECLIQRDYGQMPLGARLTKEKPRPPGKGSFRTMGSSP